MDALRAARDYFEAWNRHDPAAVVACFADGGTYRDPVVASGLVGPAIGAYVDGLVAAFPDLTFEIGGVVSAADGSVAAEWVMRGTNRGELDGKPATGREVALPGADFIAVGDDGIRSVVGYFDQKTFAKQLGLQVLVQPPSIGSLALGSGSRLDSGKRTKPGAMVITWIDVRSEDEAHEVRHRAIAISEQMSQMSGFLGYTGIGVGRRLYAVTAWEDPESPQQLLRGGAHRDAMGRAMGPDLSEAFQTSVWVPVRQNPMWMRCAACGQMQNVETLDGSCPCGEPLAERPAYF